METKDTPSFMDVVKSVMAGFLGVQSDKNRERDFKTGNPLHYIIIGLVGTILFVAGIWAIVAVILKSAGVK